MVFSDAGMGSLYTSAKGPVAVTGNKLGTKVGTGDQTNILGLIVQGDASVNSIAKNAGISKVSHVDYEVSTILGFFGTKRIVVYGE